MIILIVWPEVMSLTFKFLKLSSFSSSLMPSNSSEVLSSNSPIDLNKYGRFNSGKYIYFY